MTKNFSVVIKQNGQQMTNYIENIRASGIKQGFKKLLTKYPELDNHNIDIVLSNEKGRYKYVHSDNRLCRYNTDENQTLALAIL